MVCYNDEDEDDKDKDKEVKRWEKLFFYMLTKSSLDWLWAIIIMINLIITEQIIGQRINFFNNHYHLIFGWGFHDDLYHDDDDNHSGFF